MNAKSSLFSELRRRNVFRVALTYAVVAWLLIEIASVVLPLLDAPEWIVTAFVVLLALGFALALLISWSFEMTPEGLKRTQDLSPDEEASLRKFFDKHDIGMLALLIDPLMRGLRDALRYKNLLTKLGLPTAS